MPFTLLHLGPGFAIKGLLGDNFNILTFGVAQIAIDIEPLIGLIRGAELLHTGTHTYLGAIIIAFIVMMIAPMIVPLLLRRWNQELAAYRLNWLIAPEPLPYRAIISGSLLGTISHIALDSIMHSDMTPFAPWSISNNLLHLISLSALENWCLGFGIGGIVFWLTTNWLGAK